MVVLLLRVITEETGEILFSPLGSAGSPDLHLNPQACLMFTGLKLPPFGTSPVFISALSCLVSTDLTYRFVRVCPPRSSPVRLLPPGTLLFVLCSLQQNCQLRAWQKGGPSWPLRQAFLVRSSYIFPEIRSAYSGTWLWFQDVGGGPCVTCLVWPPVD